VPPRAGAATVLPALLRRMPDVPGRSFPPEIL